MNTDDAMQVVFNVIDGYVEQLVDEVHNSTGYLGRSLMDNHNHPVTYIETWQNTSQDILRKAENIRAAKQIKQFIEESIADYEAEGVLDAGDDQRKRDKEDVTVDLIVKELRPAWDNPNEPPF